MNGSYPLSDILIERSEIESEYVKLLQAGSVGSRDAGN